MRFKTIIIDDEKLARERLKMQLKFFDSKISIIGEASNGMQAIELINSLKPDLVFLDIQMPEKNGFEVLEDINHNPLVIFCTAYDEYALKAFECSGIDYLVKPVKEERLAKSIEKIDSISLKSNREDLINIINQLNKDSQKTELTSIPVKVGNKVVFVKIRDIAFFNASDKYVNIHTINNKEYLIEQSLNYLEQKLSPRFLRVHRSYLVNNDCVKEIKKYFGSKHIIIIDDVNSTIITSGRKYNQSIKKMMSF